MAFTSCSNGLGSSGVGITSSGWASSDQLSWSLRVFRGVADQAFRLLTLDDRDHSILVRAPALSRTGQSGDEHEDRHQDRRADEDDEARKKLSACEELEHRDDDISCRKRNKRPGEATRPVTFRIRQPGRVAGDPDQGDEDQDPLETRFFSQRVNMPSYVV